MTAKITFTDANDEVMEDWPIVSDGLIGLVSRAIENSLIDAGFCTCDDCDVWYLADSLIEKPGPRLVCVSCQNR